MRRPYNGTYPITREFGVYDPAYANYPDSKHPGTDYGIPNKTPLVAAMSGTAAVFIRGNTSVGRGNEVVITNGSTQVKYCHLDRIDVVEGQQVKEGQQIGLCGWTGYVLPKSEKGAHLHFEVLISGVYVNPEEQFKEGEEVNTRERVIAVFQAYLFKTATEAEITYWVGRPCTELDDSAASSRFAIDAQRIASLEAQLNKKYVPVTKTLYEEV